MPKRARIDSQASEALSLDHLTGSTKTFVKQPSNPKAEEFYGVAKVKNAKQNIPRLPSLYSLLYPTIKIKRIGYGIALSGFSNKTAGGGTASATTAIKKLTNNPGKQNVYTFVHLPLRSFGYTSGGTATDVQTGYTVNNMIAKAKDASNVTTSLSNQILSTQTNYAAGTTTIGQSPAYSEARFVYKGGYTKHTFVNVSNIDATVKIAVSRPRRMLACTFMTNANIETLNVDSTLPIKLALVDKARSQPLNNGFNPVYSNTPFDEATDLGFQYSKNDSLRNYHWRTEFNSFKLPPGETLNFTIKHGAFSFTDSLFDTYLISGLNNLTGGPTARPDFAPFCSVIMDVFVTGESVHTAGEAWVGNGTAQLTHEQTEYHSFRSIPFMREHQMVLVDDRAPITQSLVNSVLVNDPVFRINEEQETEEQMLT